LEQAAQRLQKAHYPIFMDSLEKVVVLVVVPLVALVALVVEQAVERQAAQVEAQ
jgi:hypothetical protein